MGARWYESRIGRWISADTIVPSPANSQSFNRYTYVAGNPLKYVDPSGHVWWIPILAAGGAILTSATYLITTPAADRSWTDLAIVAGAGAAGGALIGTGVGAAPGLAMVAGAAGVGTVASAEGYMSANSITGDSFDRTDFLIETGAGAVEGAVAGIPGVNPLVPILGSTVVGGGVSIAKDVAHGRQVDPYQALTGAGQGLVSGAAAWAFTGGIRAPDPNVVGPGIPTIDLQPQAWPMGEAIARANRSQAARAMGRTVVRDTLFYLGDAALWYYADPSGASQASDATCSPSPSSSCP